MIFGAFALVLPLMVLVGKAFEMLAPLCTSPREPRAVFLDLICQMTLLLVLYPPIFALGLWSLISGQALLKRSNQLMKLGRVASGVILYRFGVPGLRYAGVAYQYEVPVEDERVQVITQAEYNQKARRRFEVGDQVSVRYLPDDPGICRLEIGTPQGLPESQ